MAPLKSLAAASRRLLSRHNIWNSFAVSRFNHSLAGPYVSVSLGQREYMTMEFFLMFPAQISILSRHNNICSIGEYMAIEFVGCFPRKTRYSTTITSTHTKLDLWRGMWWREVVTMKLPSIATIRFARRLHHGSCPSLT